MFKDLTVLHNPGDCRSVAFVNWLKEQGIDFCLINWYSNNNHPKQEEEAWRFIHMVVSGALDDEPKCAPPPSVEYTDEEIEAGDYPNGYEPWIRTCSCHSGEGYIGPCVRSLPAVVMELEDGTLGIWDLLAPIDRGEVESLSPAEMWKQVLQPQYMVESVSKGVCLAGGILESAKQLSDSPYYGNHLMRVAVLRHVLKYCTLKLPQEKDKILVEVKRTTWNQSSFTLQQTLPETT